MNSRSLFLKKLDVVLMVVFPFIAVVLSLAFEANFLWSTFLFFGIPAIWLSFRTPHRVLKTGLFAFLFSLPFSIVVDYLVTTDGGWFVPFSAFSFRVFDVIPVDDLIWAFLYIYFVLIFYEHFLDKGKHGLIDKRMKYLLWPLIILVTLFTVFVILRPESVRVSYAYLLTGIVLIIPSIVTVLSLFPRLLSKYVKVGSYFFALSFVYELTALQLNHWSFPGEHFIGWVLLFQYRFPFEEFFFWMILAAISTVSFYEFFDDDRK